MRRTTLALPGAILLGLMLSGCGFVHKHFGRSDVAYQKSIEERPLEVPPDLDMPNMSGAMTVPAPGSESLVPPPSTQPAGASPQEAAAAPQTTPPPVSGAPGVVLSGDGLAVADTVDSTYARVGLALQRGGAARISARDDAGHSYSVETTGQATTHAGWFKRMVTLGHAGKTAVGVHLTVRISADGNASRVSIEGATDDASQDAAHELLNTLRQRLS